MATLAGSRIRTPRGMLSWQPAAFVAKAFEFITASSTDKYVLLGVIGNWAHLTASNPGDHTPYSEHDLWLSGKHYVPKKGFVYAIDAKVPEPAKFEAWFLGRLRAGFYPGIKYWNINHRHWARRVVVAGKPFGKSSRSGDDHLHLSGMPGHEYAVFDVLGDYEHWRTTGRNRGDKPKPPTPAQPGVLDAAVRKLPPIGRGHTTVLVGIAQAGLVARELLPPTHDSVDRDFGPRTEAAVRRLQTEKELPSTGRVDTATWDKLFPEQNPTVSRGDEGYYPLLMQALLLARGFNPGKLDGAFGDDSVAALKRFQAAKKVKNSVVRGRGDGIGGNATWVALVTP
jgi:peptidoglycan hydrolase-like protein with peptidoglycan-binding domain